MEFFTPLPMSLLLYAISQMLLQQKIAVIAQSDAQVFTWSNLIALNAFCFLLFHYSFIPIKFNILLMTG